MATQTIERQWGAGVPAGQTPHSIELDPAAHAAVRDGRRINLSRREFALLQLLLAHAGEPVSRDRIAHQVWNGTCAANVVDVYIGYLRRKLGADMIHTVRGVGYRMDEMFSSSHPQRPSVGRERPVDEVCIGQASRVAPIPPYRKAPTPLQVVDRQTALVAPVPGMIGDSPAMQRVYQLARAVAPRSVPVLITGATGTGKELVARAIHDLSPRSARRMITINCAAIPEALLESELFGHTRGAFTGAVQSSLGLIHGAQGGTLFLDEIGELPLALQAKLLRFLESGELQRLGSPDVFRMDVRVVTASNADLESRVQNGRFRDDLFYRLAVVPIVLPSLADRPEDVLPLARHFLADCDRSMRFAPDAQILLRERRWRGNVRELRHAVERAAILAAPGDVIGPEHLMD